MSSVFRSMVRCAFWRPFCLGLLFAALAVMVTAPSAYAATIVVTTTTDENVVTGNCSLREAITAANTDTATNDCAAGSGADTITFNIPGAALSTRTITLQNALGEFPSITTPMTIDGWSQGVFDGTGGYNAAPLVELDGTNLANSSQAGLRVDGATANGVLIRGLVINRFASSGSVGVHIRNGASNVTLHGNYVGLNAAGTAAAGNGQYGIHVQDATTSDVTIGGTTAAERNVVSGNALSNGWGIYIQSSGSNITVQGNYAGTNAAGTAAIPNSLGIVSLSTGANIVIGGTAAGAGNLVSGNVTAGIGLGGGGAGGVRVEGNLIGANASGTGLIASAGSGILFSNLSTTGTIGGTTAAARNVIVGHGTAGVTAGATQVAHAISIQGNYLGVMPDGTTAGANSFGVTIGATTGITIGGTAAGAGNLIANNTVDGIAVTGADTRVLIRGNSIFNNGTTAAHLGIDLNNDGVTANDAGDADSGPNTLLNFPVLSTAVLHSGATRVTGTLNSAANTTYDIDLYTNTSCDTSGNGEGRTYLGSTTVTTDGTGNGVFATASLPATTVGQPLTATASNLAAGATSEFSVCFLVTNTPGTLITVTPTSGLITTEAGGTATFTVQLPVALASAVTINVSSSAIAEGTVSPATLTFQPDATGVVARTVTVTGRHHERHSHRRRLLCGGRGLSVGQRRADIRSG